MRGGKRGSEGGRELRGAGWGWGYVAAGWSDGVFIGLCGLRESWVAYRGDFRAAREYIQST